MHALWNHHWVFDLTEANRTFGYVVAFQIGNELLNKSIRTALSRLLFFGEASDEVVNTDGIVSRRR